MIFKDPAALRQLIKTSKCARGCLGSMVDCGINLKELTHEETTALEALWAVVGAPPDRGPKRHAAVNQVLDILRGWLAELERNP